MHSELETLKSELDTLKAQMDHSTTRFAQVEAQLQQANRRARLLGGFALALVVGAISLSTLKPVRADGGSGPTLSSLQQEINAMQVQITNLMQKTRYMFTNGDNKTTSFVGCNVLIQSGSGSTSDGAFDITGHRTGISPTGLGNLIIGYNALRGAGYDSRIGSHNLILGDYNNYSSCGGLVVGQSNAITGPYASVSGGFQNTASGVCASASAGQFNIASADYSSVSGGQGNTASGNWSSVSGGEGNLASEDGASVSGGEFNTASGFVTTVSGGFQNTASQQYSSVSGGYQNTASGLFASVSGGYQNRADNAFASVLGGSNNEAYGKYSIVCGGYFCSAGGNNPNGDFTANLGGFGTGVVTQYGHNP